MTAAAGNDRRATRLQTFLPRSGARLGADLRAVPGDARARRRRCGTPASTSPRRTRSDFPTRPGNPFFVLLGRFFAMLPIAPNVAMRINILAALCSASAAGMWFLITERVLVGWLPERWQRIVGGTARGADRRDRVHRLVTIGRQRKGLYRFAPWAGAGIVADGALVRRSRWAQGGSAARAHRLSERAWLRESHGRIPRRARGGDGGCADAARYATPLEASARLRRSARARYDAIVSMFCRSRAEILPQAAQASLARAAQWGAA